jgi:hypothetical protein
VTRLRFWTGCIFAVLVFALSLMNAARPIRRMRLHVLPQANTLPIRDADVVHARSVIDGLHSDRLAYFDEEPGWNTIEAVGEYYAVQYSLAPIILRRDSKDDEYALVNFRLSKKPTPMPGYNLIEDLGAGLALYRRR